MRILVSADLHYNIPRSRAPTQDLAARVCTMGGDVLVLAGDTAGVDFGMFREALRLFDGFRGLKLLVPGNHCLWAYGGGDSLHRYRTELPAMAAEEDFILLDHNPQVLDRVGLAGSIGWYDYSFADTSLGIPTPFYQAKISPGAADRLGQRELVDAHAADLKDRHMNIAVRWIDGQYVKLGMSDIEFTEILVHTLQEQMKQLSGLCDRMVIFMHHLPFVELVPRDRPDRFNFTAAFMGSKRFGQVLRKFPKITNVFCGHSHWRSRIRIDQMDILAIGSTYRKKQMEVLELQ